ncbi:MAG: nucleotide sugar dehydrogenase [Flavobacteriaceae bacterium]|nr:nucleotide sugar dehydrogenase [Flavobacteriaceae bacterium]
MEQLKIGIVGLGYVGLPLAAEFAKKFKVIGFDIKKERVKELKQFKDSTLEVDTATLQLVIQPSFDNYETALTGLWVTDEVAIIKQVNFFIVTVPTPVDKNNHPDLTPLFKASETIGKVLKKGDVVVYESTVYPGATEEDCVPILESNSNLVFNQDFFVGYSPERINPGDKVYTVTKILKITSGSTPEIAQKIDAIYKTVITAGTYLAPSIKVAEAAKVIENSQRDINIAFVNELSKIFRLMNIDTREVLDAAATKWNFLPFNPGLVGGHCISVDPYYLAQKAISLGYNPEIILSGRRLNDSMGPFVATETIKLMVQKDIPIKNANVLVLGITFKENCPDIRNSRVIDIIEEFHSYHINVEVYDPWASEEEVASSYGIHLLKSLNFVDKKYDAVVFAVAHHQFKSINLKELTAENLVIFDVKGVLSKAASDSRL